VGVKSKKPLVFQLRGEQTVRTITETHKALVSALAGAPSLVIDASDLGESDLTAVQLIEAARLAAARDGKCIAMASPLPDALRNMLERGGFLASPSNALFWTAP
jgi:ABC-type transporter Mla MlaB component